MRTAISMLALAMTAAVSAAVPAAANDQEICESRNGPAPAAIEACTRRITSGGVSGHALALAHYNRAFRLYHGSKDLDGAVKDLDAGIKVSPKFALALALRGEIWMRRGDLGRALADLDQAIKADPTESTAWRTRSQLWKKKSNLDRAMVDVNEAIRLNSNYPDAHNSRGILFRMRKDLDRALADFTAAIGLNPRHAPAFYNRALIYADKKDYLRAVTDLDQAIKIDPKNPSAFSARGRAYEMQGELPRARGDFNAALNLPLRDENDPWAHNTARQRLAVLGNGPVVDQQALTQQDASKNAVVGTKRVALVIGNSAYQHSPKLTNPVNDSLDVATILRRLGFDVVEGRDLDKAGMDNAVRQFGRKLSNVDVALFFYAGHGLQVSGKNYLVPIDAKLERAADLPLDAVDVQTVLSQMETEAKVNLVFLDACRDNPFAGALARSLGTRSGSVGQGLATIQSGVGTLIAYATQPDAVALDGSGRNSPFTAALVKHLSTPNLEIGAIMRRVRADVIAVTKQKQVPWDHSSLIGDVILTKS